VREPRRTEPVKSRSMPFADNAVARGSEGSTGFADLGADCKLSPSVPAHPPMNSPDDSNIATNREAFSMAYLRQTPEPPLATISASNVAFRSSAKSLIPRTTRSETRSPARVTSSRGSCRLHFDRGQLPVNASEPPRERGRRRNNVSGGDRALRKVWDLPRHVLLDHGR